MEEFHNDIGYLWQALRSAQEESEKYKNNFMCTLLKSSELDKKLKYFEKSLEESLKTKEELGEELKSVSLEFKRQKELVDEAGRLFDRMKKLTAENQEAKKNLEDREKNGSLLALKISELESELKTQGELMAKKDELLSELKTRVRSLLDSEKLKKFFSGENDPRLDLLSRLEKNEAETEKLKEQIKILEKEGVELRGREETLSSGKKGVEKSLLKAEEKAAAFFGELVREKEKNSALGLEKTELDTVKTKMSAELSRLSEDLKSGANAKESLSKDLLSKDLEISNYKDALKSAMLKIEEEKNNFSDAVKKVFSLQSSLYELKDKFKNLSEENSSLQSQLEDKKFSLEKINMLLANSGMELRQEKEITKRLTLKAEELNGEMTSLNRKSRKQHSDMLDLVNRLSEKEEDISALKNQLGKIDDLQAEVEELKRRNLKLTGMLRKDQFDFNDRIIANLNKMSREIRLSQLKNPALSRTLIPVEKNFLNVINLMKSWQDYIDDSPLQKETVKGREFLENFFNPWEKVFIRKKIVFIKNNILPDTVKTRLNREKIKIALYQLIRNEYEYLPVGATLRILIKKDDLAKNIIMNFEDTSEGLPPEVADRLFRPFNTSKKDHAGIGFAIAHRVFSLHDGTLKVSSGERKGLNIEIVLPIYNE